MPRNVIPHGDEMKIYNYVAFMQNRTMDTLAVTDTICEHFRLTSSKSFSFCHYLDGLSKGVQGGILSLAKTNFSLKQPQLNSKASIQENSFDQD